MAAATPSTTNGTSGCAPALKVAQYRSAEGLGVGFRGLGFWGLGGSCLEGGARGGAPGAGPDAVAGTGGVGCSRRLQAQQAAHLLYGEGHLSAQAWSLLTAWHDLLK